MRKTVVLLVATITLVSGCYLGRTPTRKREAYALNGVAMGLGSLLIVSVLAGGHGCVGYCENSTNGPPDHSKPDGFTLVGIGAGVISAGVAALIVTATLPTEPEPERVRIPTSLPAGVVTVPGLQPAAVTLR